MVLKLGVSVFLRADSSFEQFQLQGTSTYLIGTGRSRILIDSGEGVPIWLENLAQVLETNGLEISHVLLTHWHGDHTGGVPQLIERYPALTTSIYKHTPDKGQRPIYDGQVFSVEGATIRALLTPGHSIDHMCFVLEEENALFTGDNVLGHGFTVVEDLGVFMASLEKMRARNCAKGYPAHGVVIDDLPTKISLYAGRYLRRERQVVATLKRHRSTTQKGNGSGGFGGRSRLGSLTVKELVSQLYGNVSDEISEAALQPSIDETLAKLAEDGKVGFELDLAAWSHFPCKRWFVLAH